jgi:purine catabolism regulator
MDSGMVFRPGVVHPYSPCVPIVLRDLVAVEALALRPRTGDAGLDRLVRWVAPTELADPTAWMDGGELILTTGLRQRTAAAQTAFVERLAEAGAAGIGFGTGLSHNTVPRATLVAALRCGLPVLEVPYDTPFIAITRRVADRLAAEQFSDQRRLVDAHDRLTQAVLAGDGLDQLIRTLSRQTGTRAAVLLADGTALAGQPPAEPSHILSVEVDSVPAARLVAGPTAYPEPLPYAARLAGLELARRLSFLAGRRFLLGRLLRDMFDGRLRGEGLQWLLSANGVHPEEPYCALVGGWGEDRSATADESLRRLSRVAWSVRQFSTVGPSDRTGEAGGGAVSAIIDRQLVVLVPQRLDVEGQVRALLEALRLDPVRGPAAAVGVGAPRGGAVGIEHGYLEARTAASRGPGVHRAAPLTLSGLLLSRPDAAVRGLSGQILEPLVRFDALHSAGLVETLYRFLAADGSVQATAEQLFVHRNTVRYRLDQIERLTGRTLTATSDRTELWLALLTRDGTLARAAIDGADAKPATDQPHLT